LVFLVLVSDQLFVSGKGIAFVDVTVIVKNAGRIDEGYSHTKIAVFFLLEKKIHSYAHTYITARHLNLECPESLSVAFVYYFYVK
jgi:hypothetical protein